MATFCEGIVQNIERTECIGNSLVKINSNFTGLETAGCDLEGEVSDLNFRTTLNFNSLSAFLTTTQIETVIGSTATLDGAISATTKAQGSGYFPAVNRLADFRWEKANGTVELVRMETVTPSTYTPWQNFFPYKPAGNIKSTKFTVTQPVMDSSSSQDCMDYIFYVDWVNKLAWMTGSYKLFDDNFTAANFVFNKKWSFVSGNEVVILSDSNTAGANYNQLGERHGTSFLEANPPSPLKAQVAANGILKIPVWFYTGFNETSNVSIFIENTFFAVPSLI
jgi:hypothetical protein